ncbi:MAG TPA: hypothetical protein PKY10_02230 [Lentisphaeria bacterium]|nr:hypothetical protein [Lentisphaeria bacterium]
MDFWKTEGDSASPHLVVPAPNGHQWGASAAEGDFRQWRQLQAIQARIFSQEFLLLATQDEVSTFNIDDAAIAASFGFLANAAHLISMCDEGCEALSTRFGRPCRLSSAMASQQRPPESQQRTTGILRVQHTTLMQR